MNHRKWIHSSFFYTLMFAAFAALAIISIASADASERDDNPPPAEVDQNQAQRQGQAQGQHQGQNASGEGYASADSTGTGTGTATNEGNNNTTNNRSSFFAFNSSLPNAGPCFGAAQGGGGGSSGGGFFGLRMLNNDCWFSALAEAEENVEVRARLKCASKMFRNAIAYDKPKGIRQQRCIGFMVDTYVAQIDNERAQVQTMLDAQTLIISDHVTTATERTTDTLVRVVETCSDCYGQKSK